MFNLKKLLNSYKEKETKVDDLQSFPPVVQLKYQDLIVEAATIDQVFYSALLGVNSVIDHELNPFESEALRQLEALLTQDLKTSNLLPRQPAILPKVMHSLREDNSTANDISRLIEQDPVLVADVMKLVNSPFYMTRSKIVTLQQATTMLGRDGLRKLVIGAVMKPLLNQDSGHFSKIASRYLWDHSGKTALAASVINTGSEENIFHAYLAGILHNIGYILSLKVLDKAFDGNYSPNSKFFHERFAQLSRALTLEIAKSWSMPKQVCQALENEKKKNADHQSLAFSRDLFIADKLAKTAVFSEKLAILPQKTNILVNREICRQCKYAFDNISFSLA